MTEDDWNDPDNNSDFTALGEVFAGGILWAFGVAGFWYNNPEITLVAMVMIGGVAMMNSLKKGMQA